MAKHRVPPAPVVIGGVALLCWLLLGAVRANARTVVSLTFDDGIATQMPVRRASSCPDG